MKKKISPILIIIVLLVLVALVLFIYSMTHEGNTGGEDDQSTVIESQIPKLELSLNTNDKNQSKVTITAIASMDDGSAIESITLPSGEVMTGAEKVNYDVTANGDYTFKAKAANGQEREMSITVTNVLASSASNPYIPEGFEKVEGTTVEDGLVIKDDYDNEFVWIPIESGKISEYRKTILDAKYAERDTTSSALVNSVAKYYGFYVGRFEASQLEMDGGYVASSREGQMPWTNVSFAEANEAAISASEKFGYEGYETALMNSYTWDTVLSRFDALTNNGYSSSTNYGNYSGSIYPTGTTDSDKILNICDIAGNVSEWTTENYIPSESEKNKDDGNVNYKVIRGGSANLSRTPISHRGYPETQSENYWGFRLILFKK